MASCDIYGGFYGPLERRAKHRPGMTRKTVAARKAARRRKARSR